MVNPGLLLLAHGSPDPRHAAGMERLTASVRARAKGPVELAFLEHDRPDAATVALTLRDDGADEIAIVPLLLAAGTHQTRDLPVAVAAAAGSGLPVAVAPALGPDPLLVAACRQRLADDAPAGARVVLGHTGPVGSATATVAAETAAAAGWQCLSLGELGELTGTAAGAVVVQFLLADGVLGDRLRAATTWPQVGRLGDAPALADLVIARAEQAMRLSGSAGAPTPA
jgi:sirohydrochlorin ferrochelatase